MARSVPSRSPLRAQPSSEIATEMRVVHRLTAERKRRIDALLGGQCTLDEFVRWARRNGGGRIKKLCGLVARGAPPESLYFYLWRYRDEQDHS